MTDQRHSTVIEMCARSATLPLVSPDVTTGSSFVGQTFDTQEGSSGAGSAQGFSHDGVNSRRQIGDT